MSVLQLQRWVEPRLGFTRSLKLTLHGQPVSHEDLAMKEVFVICNKFQRLQSLVLHAEGRYLWPAPINKACVAIKGILDFHVVHYQSCIECLVSLQQDLQCHLAIKIAAAPRHFITREGANQCTAVSLVEAWRAGRNSYSYLVVMVCSGLYWEWVQTSETIRCQASADLANSRMFALWDLCALGEINGENPAFIVQRIPDADLGFPHNSTMSDLW